VKFDMCASSDPDGDPLTFKYVFGDGQGGQGACSETHTYQKPTLAGASAVVTATLSVTDGLPGHEQSRDFPINATCPTPKVKLTSPASTPITSGCNSILMTADATDPAGIDFVEFKVTDPQGFQTTVGTDFTAPYQATWQNYFIGGNVEFTAVAYNSCGNSANDEFKAQLLCYRGIHNQSDRLSVTSDLVVPGGRGQLVLNETALSFPGEGRSMAQGRVRSGENRISAELVEGAGPGTWRFELGGLPGFKPGSLRVVAGEAVTVGTDSIEFRLKGVPGERLVFAFRVE
jgi:hypothetical protein